MRKVIATKVVGHSIMSNGSLRTHIDSVGRVTPGPRSTRWQVCRSGGGVEYYATKHEAMAAL